MRALGRLVIDALLLEADPARKALEEAVALRHLPQGCGGARRQQAEIAGIFRNFVARAEVHQRVECLHAEPMHRRLVFAMRLGGVDHVIAVIEPMADELVDQIGRMLAVAVDEQHRAVARMFEAGEQGGFLAEIARQRNHLHVDAAGGQGARDRKSIVARSVVDIDEFATKPARALQLARGRRPACHAGAASPAASLKQGTTIDRPALRLAARACGRGLDLCVMLRASGIPSRDRATRSSLAGQYVLFRPHAQSAGRRRTGHSGRKR